MNVKIKTKGMHCASCEVLVKDSLEEIAGVNSVSVSFKTGVIIVDYDDKKISEKEIIEIIKKDYEVV